MSCAESHDVCDNRSEPTSLNQNDNLGIAVSEQDHGDRDEQMQLERVDVAGVARRGFRDCRERLFLARSLFDLKAGAVRES